ncbi:hypothetical protein Q8F55_000669 [Vanrija albida]|uniref:Uncharacterized protein n=1 Tax=Vanrija albida TaxID=181172 RepID=A0ABR3QDX4_9TREE
MKTSLALLLALAATALAAPLAEPDAQRGWGTGGSAPRWRRDADAGAEAKDSWIKGGGAPRWKREPDADADAEPEPKDNWTKGTGGSAPRWKREPEPEAKGGQQIPPSFKTDGQPVPPSF